MKPQPWMLLAALAAPLLPLSAWVALDTYAAYHSPFRSTRPEPVTPRMQAYLDLAETARRRAEEEARRAELLASLDTEKMVGLGQEIVHGRGLCFNCHSIGGAGGGTQGPDLLDIGARAGSRVEGLSDVEYLAQSLYQPEAVVVDGFAASMTPANEPPIGLGDDEILWVVAYLQSLGGTPTVEPGARIELP